MQNYQSILVAVDFSEHSEQALERALVLSNGDLAMLDVIHVVTLPTYPILEDVAVLGLPGVWEQETSNSQLQLAKERLNQLASQYGLKSKQCNVLVCNAETEIINRAKQTRAQLIVLGSHGFQGFKSVLGSTVDRVLHNSPCDVLTVYLEIKGE